MTQVELAELIARLRSYLNGGPDACLKGTPMIPLHRNTVAEIVDALERALPISCEDEVERVARALANEHDESDGKGRHWALTSYEAGASVEYWNEQARAAIAAMRLQVERE